VTYSLTLTLPGLPSTPNARQHFMARARETKQWKRRVFSLAWPKRPEAPLTKASITFTRCSSVRPDYDNLVASFKPVLDGLRQARVIVDDKWANVGAPEYRWEMAKKAQGRILIRVESIQNKERESVEE